MDINQFRKKYGTHSFGLLIECLIEDNPASPADRAAVVKEVRSMLANLQTALEALPAPAIPEEYNSAVDDEAKSCDCYLCKRTKQFRQALERTPATDQEFWKEIYNKLFHAESDRDYYQARLDGSWPTPKDRG